jgi:zinc transporter, ZIP family
MGNVPLLVLFASAMGLSIFLSLPIVLAKSYASRTMAFLNAAAIGILIFLLADVFSDAAVVIYTNPLSPYLADTGYAVAFVLAVVLCFLLLFGVEHRSSSKSLTPTMTALIVALAIGFQNLTEGLVFGAFWALGAVGPLTVVFVGFFLQNVTEGFPIAAPLLNRSERRIGLLVAFYLIGGLPTIIGGIAGYYYTNNLLLVIFDALAIGAILYCILPMLRQAFRPSDDPRATYVKQQLTYLGILAGFAVGFLVNAV